MPTRARRPREPHATERRVGDGETATFGAEQVLAAELDVSKNSSTWLVPVRPIIGWLRPTVRRGMSLSTRNSETCRGFAAASVTADTMKKSENSPSLMKCFCPNSCQPLPSRTARVVIAAASDPAPGSVIAIEHVRSPRTAGSSQRSFCASVPSSSDSYTLPKARRIRMSFVWPNCSSTSIVSTADKPPPPYSAGMFIA